MKRLQLGLLLALFGVTNYVSSMEEGAAARESEARQKAADEAKAKLDENKQKAKELDEQHAADRQRLANESSQAWKERDSAMKKLDFQNDPDGADSVAIDIKENFNKKMDDIKKRATELDAKHKEKKSKLKVAIDELEDAFKPEAVKHNAAMDLNTASEQELLDTAIEKLGLDPAKTYTDAEIEATFETKRSNSEDGNVQDLQAARDLLILENSGRLPKDGLTVKVAADNLGLKGEGPFSREQILDAQLEAAKNRKGLNISGGRKLSQELRESAIFLKKYAQEQKPVDNKSVMEDQDTEKADSKDANDDKQNTQNEKAITESKVDQEDKAKEESDNEPLTEEEVDNRAEDLFSKPSQELVDHINKAMKDLESQGVKLTDEQQRILTDHISDQVNKGMGMKTDQKNVQDTIDSIMKLPKDFDQKLNLTDEQRQAIDEYVKNNKAKADAVRRLSAKDPNGVLKAATATLIGIVLVVAFFVGVATTA